MHRINNLSCKLEEVDSFGVNILELRRVRIPVLGGRFSMF